MSRLVSELIGDDLALWVARAEKMIAEWVAAPANVWIVRDPELRGLVGYIGGDAFPQYAPQEDWAQGGPIIEKAKIDIGCANIIKHLEAKGRVFIEPHTNHDAWRAEINGKHFQFGVLPLEAAMRALVASVYGDTVPDEVAL